MTYLPEWEKNKVLKAAKQTAFRTRAYTGIFPATLSVKMGLDDGGELQEAIDFLLVESDRERAVYESISPIESGGAPGACLRVEVNVF